MRPETKSSLPTRRLGFTLVELLVVIAIIAILAAMLMPVLSRVKVKAQVQQARLEIGSILRAIHEYESDFSRFPVSSNAMNAASAAKEDFTYGSFGADGRSGVVGELKTPTGTTKLTAVNASLADLSYQTNNAEVMAILLDLEYFPNGAKTVNFGHIKNPNRKKYLTANLASDTKSSGVGQDGVYRDPWGNPYIITMDLNYDEKTRDSFYRKQSVSQTSGTAGFNGLFNAKSVPDGNSNYFETNDKVMVWSLGPDRMWDPNAKANQGANKDNVLSWKQ